MTRDGPLWTALLAIGAGAMLGAWLRWALGYWFNPRLPALPLGTLAANLIGGYLVGVVLGWLALHPAINPFWRLLLVTGFLGSLTTFSTFSAESVALLQGGQYGAALAHGAAHLAGSLLATVLGFATVRALVG